MKTDQRSIVAFIAPRFGVRPSDEMIFLARVCIPGFPLCNYRLALAGSRIFST
jgi:hypothetical protein